MKFNNDRILEIPVHELIDRHHGHTIVLYGSRSRGDWTKESDYDLMGFREVGTGINPPRPRATRLEGFGRHGSQKSNE